LSCKILSKEEKKKKKNPKLIDRKRDSINIDRKYAIFIMWQEIVAIDTKLNEHRSIIFRKSLFISKKDITDFSTFM
jgi:hypothetical protein